MSSPVICEKHGFQSSTLVCPHVEERYNRRTSSHRVEPVLGICDDSLPPGILFWCCSECILRYGLDNKDQTVNFLEIDDDLFKSLVPICNVCFDAWRTSEPFEFETRS